ncbi:hypothetical protein [Kribbella sp. NBC_00359]|uniref:hypothetical protein n=1 Tax=Kribbella sp. NBC_00359 TaxID=2975966 RepID=UPI002E1EC70C
MMANDQGGNPPDRHAEFELSEFELSELGPRSYDTVAEHTTRRWLAWMYMVGSTVVVILYLVGALQGKFDHAFWVVVLYLCAPPLAYYFGQYQIPASFKRLLMPGRSGGTTTDDE